MWKQRHSKRELTWISIYLRNARKMFSLHLTVPPDGSSPGKRPSHLLVERQQTPHHNSHGRGAPHTAPCAIAAAWLCPAFLFLTHPQTEPLWPGGQQQVPGNIWSPTGNRLPWPMSPAFSQSQGKGAALGDSAASALCTSACSPWIPREPSGNIIKITRETALTEN